jgi:hypothetical protein
MVKKTNLFAGDFEIQDGGFYQCINVANCINYAFNGLIDLENMGLGTKNKVSVCLTY